MLDQDWTRTAAGSGSRSPLDLQLERAGRGDRRAFEDLYRLSSAKLFAVCLRILPRRQEAEDALQDAFLTIWQRASRYDADRGPAIAWLTVITRNAAIDRLRKRHVPTAIPAESDDVVDPAPLADLGLIARQDDARLVASLDGLDPADAEFLRTAFLTGLTYADLAKRDRLPLGTVKSRIRRALLKLRERMA
jgi:RNA polymerase sigma factor (sigma-70 family)